MARLNCITQPCNYRNKASCPLKGKSGENFIIYKATLKSGEVAKHYYGCCETEFQTRFYNNNQNLKFRRKCNATKLLKAFWKLKDTEQNPCIEWSIATLTTTYHPGAKWCNLYLSKKLAILRAIPNTYLNKRSELNGKCRHTNKFYIILCCSSGKNRKLFC